MLPYQNPQLDIEARLDDLISRMTLDELIMQTADLANTLETHMKVVMASSNVVAGIMTN